MQHVELSNNRLIELQIPFLEITRVEVENSKYVILTLGDGREVFIIDGNVSQRIKGTDVNRHNIVGMTESEQYQLLLVSQYHDRWAVIAKAWRFSGTELSSPNLFWLDGVSYEIVTPGSTLVLKNVETGEELLIDTDKGRALFIRICAVIFEEMPVVATTFAKKLFGPLTNS